tara:strand:+ start:1419 stop:2267 length:849 start_codon:yes stop_codon:yes gene_type:complete
MTAWFKRKKQGIYTETKDKKDLPHGLWHKCPNCSHLILSEEFEKLFFVCNECNHHDNINSSEYFKILFDNNNYKELFANIQSTDPLSFVDTKKYTDRLESATKKSNINEAISVGLGMLEKKEILIASMNFNFIGGSIGAAVGEKISRSIDYCLNNNTPLLIISKSGGARMMESGLSLMQLAKTSGKLSLLSQKKIPYISLLTNPTFGGATASFSMLGDINIAEPNALIGFAGPRVIKETIGKELPDGFQRSEFLLEKGFLDFIVNRKNLKKKINNFLTLIYY